MSAVIFWESLDYQCHCRERGNSVCPAGFSV